MPAADHPSGEFWLEAAATGERWPELYVNRVSIATAADVTRRFADPVLASTGPDGFQLEYTMRAFDDADPNLTVDTGGTFGRP